MTLKFTMDGLTFVWDAEKDAWTTSDSLAEEVVNQIMAEWQLLFPAYLPCPPLAFMGYLADHRELTDVVVEDLPRAREGRVY